MLAHGEGGRIGLNQLSMTDVLGAHLESWTPALKTVDIRTKRLSISNVPEDPAPPPDIRQDIRRVPPKTSSLGCCSLPEGQHDCFRSGHRAALVRFDMQGASCWVFSGGVFPQTHSAPFRVHQTTHLCPFSQQTPDKIVNMDSLRRLCTRVCGHLLASCSVLCLCRSSFSISQIRLCRNLNGSPAEPLASFSDALLTSNVTETRGAHFQAPFGCSWLLGGALTAPTVKVKIKSKLVPKLFSVECEMTYFKN